MAAVAAPQNSHANNAMMKAAPAAASNYAVKQAMASQMGGSMRETHAISPLDELLALKSLRDLGGSKQDMELWQHYVDDSTRMLRVAAYVIERNPAITEKLGVGGFKGVLALAQMLKQRHADSVYDNIMDMALDDASSNNWIDLESVENRAKRINHGPRAFAIQQSTVRNLFGGTRQIGR